MITWHNHHILPRHAGGTDDPENLIRVNVKMHAFLHHQRFLETGDIYDKIAAATLSGQKTSTEARILAARVSRQKNAGYTFVVPPKKFVVYSPEGKKVVAENLKQFCLQNRLQSWLMHKVLSGQRQAHKGWTAKPKAKPQKQGYYKEAYPLISPEGDICIIYSLSKLSKEDGLNQGNLGMVLSGKRNHSKGWKSGFEALDIYQNKWETN